MYNYQFLWRYKTSTSSYASKSFDFCLKSCLMQVICLVFLPTSICVLHSNFWYLYINSLLEWRFCYFHMFRNPVNQFMQLNPFPAVKTFTWTGAERHAWRSRYWRPRGQIVYRRNRGNGARLLQRTLNVIHSTKINVVLHALTAMGQNAEWPSHAIFHHDCTIKFTGGPSLFHNTIRNKKVEFNP